MLTSSVKGDSALVLIWSFNSNLILSLWDVILFYFGKALRPSKGFMPSSEAKPSAVIKKPKASRHMLAAN